MQVTASVDATPLSRYVTNKAGAKAGMPIPLIGERMRVVIRGGIAVVSCEQTYRNVEDRSIEATITFPVPVHATLHRLTAKIGERTLTAKARSRTAARDTYERAIDDGRTAVLHEELLRGVHMLSIAHIAPGADIVVTHSWISALSPRGPGKALLRVPTTVADVYGDSPFTDADDLIASRHVNNEAEVTIDAGPAVATITGSRLTEGKAKVRLNAPIDIEVAGDTGGPVHGVSSDGRAVSITVVPDVGGDSSVDAAILVDRSGSMGIAATPNGDEPGARTKFAAVTTGLAGAAGDLKRGDRTELWQFDGVCDHLSDARVSLTDAVGRLGGPRGGTEIGKALDAVIAGSRALDIILITDGLSHALDVQALANSGRRFTVVLVGQDSLEANVGRLAAMTGGQIVLATGAADAAAAVQTAIGSVRRPKPAFSVETWPVHSAVVHANGATVQARWGGAGGEPVEKEFAAAVGALAASIVLPSLRHDDAVMVAADHGLVCHLTSLVIVDDAGVVQDGLPAQRKAPLMAMYEEERLSCGPNDFSPRVLGSGSDEQIGPARATSSSNQAASLESKATNYSAPTALRKPEAHFWSWVPRRPGLLPLALVFRRAVKLVDWEADPEALRRGDLSKQRHRLRRLVEQACGVPEVQHLASTQGQFSVIAIIIALMARSMGNSNRTAERIARSVLGGLDQDAVAKAATSLGL